MTTDTQTISYDTLEPDLYASPAFGRNFWHMSTEVKELFEWFEHSEVFTRYKSEPSYSFYQKNKDIHYPSAQTRPVAPSDRLDFEAPLSVSNPEEPMPQPESTQSAAEMQPIEQISELEPIAEAEQSTVVDPIAEAEPITAADPISPAQPESAQFQEYQAYDPNAQDYQESDPNDFEQIDLTEVTLPAEEPESQISIQIEKLNANISEQIERFGEVMSSQASRFEDAISAGQASMTEAITGIGSISMSGDESLKRIENAAISLSLGVDVLEDSLRQSSINAQEQNQALLSGLEACFDHFSDKISSDISTALDKNLKLPGEPHRDFPLQSLEEIQERNQTLLDGIESCFDRFSRNISSDISAALDTSIKLTVEPHRDFSLQSLEEIQERNQTLLNGIESCFDRFSRSISSDISTALDTSVKQVTESHRDFSPQLLGEVQERNQTLLDGIESCFDRFSHSISSDISTALDISVKQAAESHRDFSPQLLGEVQERNQTLLNGIESCFDRFSRSISSDISTALDTSIKQAAQLHVSSPDDTYERNRALLDGMENSFNRFTGKLSSNISSALESGLNLVAQSHGNSPLPVNDVQERNQVLLDGIESCFERFTSKISYNISTALESSIKSLPLSTGESMLLPSGDAPELNQKLLFDTIEGSFDRLADRISSNIVALSSGNAPGMELTGYLERVDEACLESHKKTAELMTVMMSEIATKMHSAMGNITSSMSNNIGGTRSIIQTPSDQLDARAEILISEYENYFTGIEQSTATILSDMDSMIAKTILGFTEQLTGAMNNFNECMTSALDRFEAGTEKMVEQFVEQSRDIGLYAHEINMDISSLSTNLKDSVTVFNRGLNESVNDTFKEIDSGISNMTMRFANTLEAIQDTVNAMPT